jgi:DNA-binding response OmpR family regulator
MACPLQDGDELQIALRFKLAFVDAGATAPLSIEGDKQGLRVDKETRQVIVNGNWIDPPLSLHQYRLIEVLWDSGGSVITRDQIVEAVWPEAASEGVSEQAIDALVRRLRERIEECDDEFRYIVTVRGHGFRLENR